MLTAFSNDQLLYNTTSGVWNVKCENAGHVPKDNVTMQTTSEFARNITANNN